MTFSEGEGSEGGFTPRIPAPPIHCPNAKFMFVEMLARIFHAGVRFRVRTTVKCEAN